jgi:hypothetical protein
MSSDINATWLFRLAQEWFITNPDEQIPQGIWEKELLDLKNRKPIQSDSSADTLRPASAQWLYIHTNTWKVNNVAPEMIPVLAAISLGFSAEALSKVTQYYNIQKTHLTKLQFNQDYSLECDYQVEDDLRPTTDAWTVTEAVVNALCFHHESADKFVKDCLPWKWKDPAELRVACLLVDEPRLWPSTFVQERMKSFLAGMETDYAEDQLITVATLNECSKAFIEFTPAQLQIILERSGHLELGATYEYGFDRRFFADLLSSMTDSKNINAKILGRLLNTTENPVLIDLISKRLCESMSEYSAAGTTTSVFTLAILQGQLDNTRYAAVLDDILLKINLLPLGQMTGERTAFESGSAFDVFYNAPYTLLTKLADHLFATDPKDFRSFHFIALERVFTFARATQNSEGVDMTGLVLRALKGLEAYHDTRHFDEGLITNEYKKRADEWITSFLSSVSNIGVTYDYSQFSALHSSDKQLMASAGFDIKKLPGMTTRDRGRVLTDQMGL